VEEEITRIYRRLGAVQDQTSRLLNLVIDGEEPLIDMVKDLKAHQDAILRLLSLGSIAIAVVSTASLFISLAALTIALITLTSR